MTLRLAMRPLAALLLLLAGCTMPPAPPGADPLGPATHRPALCGVDASFLPEVVGSGGVFRDREVAEDPLHLYVRRGVDTVRLRLWVNPPRGAGGLEPTLELARQAHHYGLKILLDLHYSDTWADPAHQQKPFAWRDLNGMQLQAAVREYTREVVLAFILQGTPPAWVQIGNEIGHGLLWDDGRVEPGRDANWIGLAELLKAGVAGVVEAEQHSLTVLPPGTAAPPVPKIILHIAQGGDNAFCRQFYDQVRLFDVPYDVIGLSYYPWWHGALADLQWNLNDLSQRYDKPVLICETAYPWTLAWADDEHNIVGREDQLLGGFPATPHGQALYLQRLREILTSVPGGRGLGLVYWAPDWLSTPGAPSAWENVTLFDFAGRLLPGLRALGAGATR